MTCTTLTSKVPLPGNRTQSLSAYTFTLMPTRIPHIKQLSVTTTDGAARLSLRHYVAMDTDEHRSHETPAIILVHGFGGNKEEGGLFPALASLLARSGMHALTYDARGIGESTGSYKDTSLEDHTTDFACVHQFIERSVVADHQLIGAVGFSLGATIVSLALKNGTRLGPLVFLSPATRPKQSMWPRYNTSKINESIHRYGYFTKPNSDMLIGRQMFEDLRTTDLGPNCFQLGHPLLVCHGTHDSRIPIRFTDDCFGASRGDNITYRRISGASHSFQPAKQHRWQVCREVSTWLSRHCLRSPAPQRSRDHVTRLGFSPEFCDK